MNTYCTCSSICQSSSWEPLDVSNKMLSEILKHQCVQEEFIEVIRSFRYREAATEEAFCGHWSRKTSLNRDGAVLACIPIQTNHAKAFAKRSAIRLNILSDEAGLQVSLGQSGRPQCTRASITNRSVHVGYSYIQSTSLLRAYA